MDIRKILTWSLGAFVLAALVVFVVQELRLANATPGDPLAAAGAAPVHVAVPGTAAASAPAAPAPTVKPAEKQRLVVMYLHGAARCRTCTRIEALTRTALQEAFAVGLEVRDIEWLSINTDAPEHAHLLQQYQTYTKAVIVSERSGDRELRWKNLARIWDLLGDEAAFKTYIQTEVRAWQPVAK